MASSKQNSVKKVQANIEENRELNRLYREELENLRAQLKEGDKLDAQLQKRVAMMEKSIKQEERQIKYLEDYNKELIISAQNLEDIDDLQGSITKAYGKNTDLAKLQNRALKQTQAIQESIVAEMITNKDLDDKKRKQLSDFSAAYGNMHMSILEADKQLASGEITLHKRNELVEEAAKKFADMGIDIAHMEGLSKDMREQIEKMVGGAESLEKAMTSAAVKHELMEHITEELSAELGGIGPILGGINKLLNTNVRDTLAWKAAVFALGAALGKAAYDYFGAPIKAGMQADKERHLNEIDGIAAVAKLRKDAEFIPAQISQERLEHEIQANEEIRKLTQEAAYAGRKAAIQFSTSMQTGAAQFERAAKTALFGKSIGGIGYGAAQMQLAGIGADKVASAMSSAAAATGKMPTGKMGADMAIMAERTGQSVDNIATINEAFQRMDGMSADMAMNMQEGMRNMADQAGIDLGNLMKEVAESSKEALGYQIKSGPALAKAVAYTQSMGVSFGDIAKAGKNMVMNYKDSIKAEMQLSSLLGEQVDLSEVRAKFAEGDQEGALKALQAQGLNPEDMDMFQQDALSQALGGMDLTSLSKIAKNKGASVGDLTAGKAGKGNKEFLATTQAAEAALSSKTASISADAAILDAKLSKEIADAYLGDPGYEEYKKKQNEAAQAAEELATKMRGAWLETDEYKKSLSDTMQLNFVDTIKEGLMGGLATVGGGLATTMIDKLIPKGGKLGKVAGMFGLGSGGGGGEEGGGGTPEAGGGGGTPEGPIASVAEQIKAAEPMLKKARPLGQGLREFGVSLGQFLKSAGKGFGNLIKGIFQGLAQGLKFFASPQVLLGAAGLAASITLIGAGIAGASWILGKALPTLAEGLMGFNKIDGGNLAKVGIGVAALGVGMVAMGVGAVAQGIGNLVGMLFGKGKLPVEQLEELGKVKLDSERIKENATAVAAYGGAMAALGAGAGIGGLGNAVGAVGDAISALFGGKSLQEQFAGMEEFAKFGPFDVDRIQGNSDAVVAYGLAMAALGGGAAVGGLGNAVGAVAGAISALFGGPSLEQQFASMEEFGRYGPFDTERIKGNSEAVVAYAKAMASLGGAQAASGLGAVAGAIGEGMAKFFGGGSDPVKQMGEMQKFAAVDIDKEKVKNNAEAFTAFGKAMSSYEGGGEGFWSGLGKGIASFFGAGDDEDLITKFDRFSKLNAGGVVGIADAIGKLNTNLSGFNTSTAEAVGDGMGSLAGATSTYLTADKTLAINQFAGAIGSLNLQLTAFGAVAPMVDTISTAFTNLASALDRLTQVNIDSINDIPWVKMIAFASAGGRITLAQSANNSFNIAQDSAKNIEKLSVDTKESIRISKNLQALLAVLADSGTAAFQLNIDGRAVTDMITKRANDRKGQNPKTGDT